MAWPVVSVASGGLAVTSSGRGLPVEEAANGIGKAVTYVSSGGVPVNGPLVLPAGAACVVSSRRLSTWSGAWARILRASDSAEQDIGFADNVPDLAAILAFVGSSAWSIKTRYDQSGNGNNLTQPTAANQPSGSFTSLANGVLPDVYDGIPGGTGKSLLIPAGLALARTNFSAFMALRQVISEEYQNFFEFTNGATTNLSCFTYGDPTANAGGLSTFDGVAAVTGSNLRPRGQMTTLALRSSVASQTFTVNGVGSVQAALAAQAMSTGGQVGAAVSQPLYNLKSDVFAVIFYPTAVSDAVHDAVLKGLNAAFAVPQTFTTRLVYGGSSLISGIGATLNQTLLRKLGLPGNVEIYNFGRSNGQSLPGEYANRAIELAMYDPTKLRNIFAIDADSNGIAGQTFANAAAALTYADTTYDGTLVPFVQAIQALGASARAAVPTIISRTPFDTTTNFWETARIQLNLRVRNGAAANNYTLIDRAGEPLLGAQLAWQNATWFNADGIHPTNAGYDLMAAIERAAILPLVA